MTRWSDKFDAFFVKPFADEGSTIPHKDTWMQLAQDVKFWDEIENDFIKFLMI